MASGLTLDDKMLVKGIQSFQSKADIALQIYAENGALKLQNYARQNRKWTDRTGHARQRLTGYVVQLANGYRLYVAHGVDYGIWLEKANEERFAILNQTIDVVGSEQIMPGLNRLLERLRV